MNKKRVVILSMILLLSVSLVSAGFFGDLFGMTGKVVDTESGLVGYYNFDSRTIGADVSGSGNDAESVGVEFVDGKFGKAAFFDSSREDYLSVDTLYGAHKK